MPHVVACNVERVAGFIGFDGIAYANGIVVTRGKQAGYSGSHIERIGLLSFQQGKQFHFTGESNAMEVGFEVVINISLYTAIRLGFQAGIGLFPQHPGIAVVQSHTENGAEIVEKACTDLGLGGRCRIASGTFGATAPHP